MRGRPIRRSLRDWLVAIVIFAGGVEMARRHVSLVLVAACAVMATPTIARSNASPGTPVFEASGYGVVRPWDDTGRARALAVRAADAGGPAEVTTLAHYSSVQRAERWNVSAAGVPYFAGYLPLTYNATAALWADMNGDGITDLICGETSPTGPWIEVMLMTPSGLQSPGQMIALAWPLSGPIASLTAADVNADGLVDLGVIGDNTQGVPGRLAWLLATAAASWTQVGTGLYADRTVGLKLNGDAFPDLINLGFASKAITFAVGQGDGTFGGPPTTTYFGSEIPRVHDLDGDGMADFVSGKYLYRGDAAGTPVLFDSLAAVVSAMEDLDHDGLQDLIALHAGRLSVARGLGGLGFHAFSDIWVGGAEQQQVSPAYFGPSGLSSVLDASGDGWSDVVLAPNRGRELDVIRGRIGGGFFQPLRLVTGENPVQVALADVVGSDGKLDLVILSRGANRIEVRGGTGDGGFLDPQTYDVPAGPRRFALGNLDQDGDLDLVVVSDLTSTISVFPGGAGGFGARTDLVAGGPLSDVKIADLNEDGTPDLCTARVSGEIQSYQGLGSLGFALAPWTTTSSGDGRLQLGDFDGDGHLDVALQVQSHYPGEIRVFPGDGHGNFSHGSEPPFMSASWVGAGTPFVLAPALGNGGIQLVYATRDSIGPNHAFFNASWSDGGGRHQLPVSPTYPRPDIWYMRGYEVPPSPTQLEIADVTGDGVPDAIILSDLCSSLTVVPSLGDGQFGTPIAHTVGTSPSSFALGDVDRDGLPDAAVADAGSNDVLILRNRGALATAVGGTRVASGLSLRVTSPIGASSVRLLLHLSSAAPAALDVFDSQGRRVAHKVIDAPVPGDRETMLDTRTLPRNGLLFVRLSQGDAIATARVVRYK